MKSFLFCIIITCLFISCKKNELNYIPEVIGPPENIQLNQGFVKKNISLEGIFDDKDGETLQITAFSNAIEVVDTEIEGSNLIITEKGNGKTKITLRATDSVGDYTETKFGVDVKPPYLRFAIISDPHYLDQTLINTPSSALQSEKNKNPLMFEESNIIFPQTIDMINTYYHPQVLIINGDLTKDGSLVSHQSVVAHLEAAASLGMQVFVVPGCRDINNFNASRYSGDNKVSVPNVVMEKYKTLYHNFGYNDGDITFSQDLNSLSYACEPQKGVYMIMIDSNSFEGNNASKPYNDKSRIKSETLDWIKSIVAQAKDERKTVITFMHGSLVDSFQDESKYFPNNLMENANSIANTLADLGIKVVFTSHNHIQDITEFTSDNGNRLTQVQTGSLMAYPNPFRIVELKTNHNLSIKTKLFSEFYEGTQGAQHLTKAKDEFRKHYSVYINSKLIELFNLSGYQLSIGTEAATQVGLMHTYGDEDMTELDQNSQISINTLKEGAGQIHDAGIMLNNMVKDKFPTSDVQFSVPHIGEWN
ncbi:metallophosphoesterase [Halosquirtibacter laminarini]|uniref:Metallophosphoesterase n=1 Tax=Halosquirtibacter laminarini TaxID=3374600 RepID=A0AC61NEV4_9BACT|nr:metallophosphoesterase [Prolixibacteraceae bacterium]